MLEAIKKLYQEVNKNDVLSDIDNDYLTEHTARNGRAVLWYLDECNNTAIYSDTLVLLTAEEIEKELC